MNDRTEEPSEFIKTLCGSDPSTPSIPSTPMLMGILNVNPDSFSDGGKFQDSAVAVAQAKRMIAEGALIIDIGGESTRPGAETIDCETEWQRIGPVLRELCAWLSKENPRRQAQGLAKVWLSVDSYKAEIARRSLELGVDILNDVSGGCSDPEILQVVAAANANYIVMHNPFVLNGRQSQPPLPHAQKEPVSYQEPLKDIATELCQLYDIAVTAGCRNIVLDPGLGFGKDISVNWQILANLQDFSGEFCNEFNKPNKQLLASKSTKHQSPILNQSCPPILIGASNKRFLRHWQEQEEAAGILEPQEISYQRFLSTNLAICAAAVLGGAGIIRSHEVREHYRCLRSSWELLRHRR